MGAKIYKTGVVSELLMRKCQSHLSKTVLSGSRFTTKLQPLWLHLYQQIEDGEGLGWCTSPQLPMVLNSSCYGYGLGKTALSQEMPAHSSWDSIRLFFPVSSLEAVTLLWSCFGKDEGFAVWM